jgi:hypothetical protein
VVATATRRAQPGYFVDTASGQARIYCANDPASSQEIRRRLAGFASLDLALACAGYRLHQPC